MKKFGKAFYVMGIHCQYVNEIYIICLHDYDIEPQ